MIEMDKIDLRKLEWDNPREWLQLIPTATTHYTGQPRLCKEDVLRFFDYKIHEVAREANLPFEEAKKVIYEENTTFLSYIDAIFDGEQVYKMDSDKIRNSRCLLVLPLVEESISTLIYRYRRLNRTKKDEFRRWITDERHNGN